MSEKARLHILWTSADIDTAQNMLLMYSTNSMIYKWWDEVTVIVWGAATRLTAENKELQEDIKLAMEKGVKFTACRACAENLGAVAILKEIGIEVKYWGEPLAELIKNREHLISVG